MSSWLKATQRRVKETILQSVGAHDKIDDLEFDEICHKFTIFSRDLVKVHMAMQLWLDSIDLFCGSWIGMGESLVSFCSPPPSTSPLSGSTNTTNNGESPLNDTELPLLQISKALYSIGADMNHTFKNIFKTIFADRCLKPIESILAVVPIINQKILQRKNVMLDVGFYKSKRQSELSSTKDPEHPSVIKITNKLNEANRSFEILSNEIINSIEELSSARTNMLGPEIAALLACMETFPTMIAQKVVQLHPLMPQTASTKCLLLASIENVESTLKSNQFVETLRSDSTIFPVQPTLRRTGTVGGTAGGYGHAGFLDGNFSTVDSLLKQQSNNPKSSPSSCSTDNNEFRESIAISRDSQSTRISSSSSSSSAYSDIPSTRTASPSPSSASTTNRPIASTKRPVVKLGQDRPISARLPSENTPETIITRPMSTPKPSFIPPKPPKAEELAELEIDDNTRRVPSKRFTASALLLSGSPRHLLGGASDPNSSISEESPEEVREEDQWNGSQNQNNVQETFIPQSIRVNHYSTNSSGGIASEDYTKTSYMTSTTSSNTFPSHQGGIASQPPPPSATASAPPPLLSSLKKTPTTTTSAPPISTPVATPIAAPAPERVIALYKFESDVEGDLPFKRDDIIEIISKDDSGWWAGIVDGRTGIFPSNYVKPVNE